MYDLFCAASGPIPLFILLMRQCTSCGDGVVLGQANPETFAGSQLRNTDGAPRDLVGAFGISEAARGCARGVCACPVGSVRVLPACKRNEGEFSIAVSSIIMPQDSSVFEDI